MLDLDSQNKITEEASTCSNYVYDVELIACSNIFAEPFSKYFGRNPRGTLVFCVFCFDSFIHSFIMGVL